MRTILQVTFACALSVILTATSYAQINMASNVINFRTSTAADQNRTTNHYGMLYCRSKSTTNGTYGILSENTSTQNTTYGIYAKAENSSYGKGGRFDGSNCGIYGVALNGPALSRCGGWFTAGNGTNFNYGIYAQVEGTVGLKYAGYFLGNVYCSGGQYLPSDIRLKNNEQPLTGSLEKIMQLKPQTYFYDTVTYAKMNLSSKKQCGLIAQETELVFPEIINEFIPSEMDSTAAKTAGNNKEPEKYKAINYVALIPVLIQAIQEQQKEIEGLKMIIEDLR